jgi:hypothetical protein
MVSPTVLSYNLGETLRIEISIPNINSSFDTPSNLRETTGLEFGRIVFNESLFLENKTRAITGTQENVSQFLMPYNPLTDNFELEVEIEFLRPGNYRWITASTFTMRLNNCVGYSIITSADLPSMDGIYEFTVQP